MKKLLLFIFLIFVNVALYAKSVQPVIISWDASPSSYITNYNVYFGLKSQQYTSVTRVSTNLTCILNGLSPNKVYFAVITSVNVWGKESLYSPEISMETILAKRLPLSSSTFLATIPALR